ncbi:MAG: DUF2975 domain-containing protein [Saccharospirillum sp.]|uniref:DUF2975 domain-containing protein n=1 Tax=Saccharospirillum sp. TaxID=2033801 RepID=UPI003299A999
MSARLLRALVNLLLGLALSFLVVAAAILLGAPLLGEPLLSQWPVLAPQPDSAWKVSVAGTDAALTLGEGVLSVEHSGYGWHWALRFVDFAISGALLMVGLWLLRRFIGEVGDSLPFSSGSAKRLRWIGLILVAFPLWQVVRDLLWHTLIRDELSQQGLALAYPFQAPAANSYQLQFSVDWGFAVTGLLLLVVAEAFRVGVSLREENEEII